MTYVFIASAALGGILLFLLAAATANSPLFAEHYPLLLGLNAVMFSLVSGNLETHGPNYSRGIGFEL